MANSDIDINSPHYKGEFGSIYEVNRKFPTGGVAGDFVVIEGWAHYWNADRATWCVNAERDSYWDELITNILEKFKLFRGATYMGVAGLDTVPEKATGVKMYYFAIVPGTYTNFGDFVVPQGINVLYSENGKSWVCSSLLEVTQEVGESEWKVVSQNLLKKTQDLINAELAKKANAADVDTKFTEEKKRVDAELAKKANAKDVEQSFSEQTAKNTEQDAEIAKKANAADVASKFTAEAARVNAELAKKANAEEVDSSLKELQNTVFPLQVSLSLDKTLLEFTGNDQTVKVSYSIKRKDALVTPSSLVLSVNGMMKDIDIKSSDTISVEVHKEGESMVVLTAKYDELVKSATDKVVMVLPVYFGFGTSEVDVAIAANKLEPRTSAADVYEKTSTKDRVNFIILAPKTLPKLSSFTMGGAPFVMITTSVVINGKDYYMYKSGGVYMSGTTVRVQAS